jgi:hypothetical protein
MGVGFFTLLPDLVSNNAFGGIIQLGVLSMDENA